MFHSVPENVDNLSVIATAQMLLALDPPVGFSMFAKWHYSCIADIVCVCVKIMLIMYNM